MNRRDFLGLSAAGLLALRFEPAALLEAGIRFDVPPGVDRALVLRLARLAIKDLKGPAGALRNQRLVEISVFRWPPTLSLAGSALMANGFQALFLFSEDLVLDWNAGSAL